MAGRVGVKITKNAGGGLRGSTSGLRFNPREAPEFAEEDRNLGRDDPEGKQRHEEKKRREKEHRHKKISGLHHINLKIPNKSRAKGDNARNDEELSEMTGPASSTGYPVDVASGAKTGGGSAMGGPNVMTGEPMDISMSLLKRKKASGEKPKRVPGRYALTEHLLGVLARIRNNKTKEKRKTMGETVEEGHLTRKSTNLGTNNTKNPSGYTGRMKSLMKRVKQTAKNVMKRIQTYRRSGGALTPIKHHTDMRDHQAGLMRSREARSQPTGMVTKSSIGLKPTLSTMGGRPGRNRALPVSPRQVSSSLHPVQAQTPSRSGVARSVGGLPIDTPTPGGGGGYGGGGGGSGMTGFQGASIIGASEDILEVTEEMILKAASLNAADITEFKWLIRELRRVLRSGALKKAGLEDIEHDGERPTPNAHRKTTSSPTGATSVDPDDDPRYWGAHPMGLLLPRRGHM